MMEELVGDIGNGIGIRRNKEFLLYYYLQDAEQVSHQMVAERVALVPNREMCETTSARAICYTISITSRAARSGSMYIETANGVF
jgi:hypothetical protein